MKELLENFSISFLEKDMATLIQKCLDAGVDPFMFGEFSAKEFLTIQETRELQLELIFQRSYSAIRLICNNQKNWHIFKK